MVIFLRITKKDPIKLAVDNLGQSMCSGQTNIQESVYPFCTGSVMSNAASETKVVNVKAGGQTYGSAAGPGGSQSEALTAEELRRRRQAYFDR